MSRGRPQDRVWTVQPACSKNHGVEELEGLPLRLEGQAMSSRDGF